MRIVLFGDPVQAAQIAALLQAQLRVVERSAAYPAGWPAGWVRIYLDAHLSPATAGPEAPRPAEGPAARGCCGCGQIGHWLATGTSGRDWKCQTCGTVWSASAAPAPAEDPALAIERNEPPSR